MKKRMAVASLALGGIAVLALSGCGAMTPEKLAGKIKKAVEKTPYSQADVSLTMDMSVGEPTTGIEMDMAISVGGQVRASYDPDTMYENLDMSIEMMGIRVPLNVEIYVLPEEDKIASYTYMDGSWMRQEISATSQVDGSLSVALWDLPADQLSLNEEVTELEGTPAACLSGTVTGKDISQAMGFLLGSLEESGSLLDEGMLMDQEGQPDLNDIDWEKISAQVDTYVDTKTYLPLRDEISITGMDEALSGLLEDSGVTLKIQQLEMTVDYPSYDPVEPCQLPEGAKEAAAQNERLMAGEPDNGDGTFTIQESGYYADIQTPEGYEVDYTSYDEVDFYSEELDRLVCYQMWTTTDSNDFFFWDKVSEEEYILTGESYGPGRLGMDFCLLLDTENYGFCVDGFPYQGTYAGYNYYAWANLDDSYYGWVLVSIYDGGDTMDFTITQEDIQALLEQVSPYRSPAGQQEVEEILDQLEL